MTRIAGLGRFVLVAALTLGIGGCALLAPPPEASTLDERLAVLPTRADGLRGTVTIHWDAHQIPFIEAEHDEDAAFALGFVHAHLRLGQMEIFRRVSQGRIAEMGGPPAVDIDHGLRILDYGRAAGATEAALPPATRAWLEAFVRGVNQYQQSLDVLPHEYTALGLEREAWTVADVLTFSRLAGTDVNWLVWFNVLRLRQRPDWPQVWTRLVENGSDSVPSFGRRETAALSALLAGVSRSGSNSLVVAPSRTRSGAAMIANDPHLGVLLPNTWLLVGLKSPSYHAVGLMAAGLPVFAIGRNPWIAWGGTNMRAASSDLIDISGLAAEDIRERRETVGVRWWLDQEVGLRDTHWGPVISDAPQLSELGLPPLALRWTGHDPSDEFSALLAVSRARDFAGFRAAFEGFAVPGQNMVYADAEGNIGQLMAVKLPRRTGLPADVVQAPELASQAWRSFVETSDLPYSLNPKRGFLVSANNRPVETEVPVGYFFSPDDRVQRMAALLGANRAVTIDDLAAVQQDVYMPSAVALRDVLMRKLDETGVAAAAEPTQRQVVGLIRAWDGHYRPKSGGALAFELFRSAFTGAFYEVSFGDQDWAAFANVSRINTLLIEDIERAAPERLTPMLRSSLAAAAKDLGKFADWGEMHRLGFAHPLSFLPLIGGRYRFGDHPIGGSTDTLMKTAHAATNERHFTRYGSNARHISDMSDMDKNHFVLLGGQDGWLNSSTFLDQATLWLDGRYIQMPLRMDVVRDRFSHKTVLSAR
ncbi:MAG: penicillin acylase family protein [Alphaproteobacteria bacterium]|nr:penicillin acylase family protein [Alphaproteobacteria bacterium]